MGPIEKFEGEFEERVKPMDVSEILTEGKFEHRIKPGTEHHPKVLNRALEELQKIVLVMRASMKKMEERVDGLEKKLELRDSSSSSKHRQLMTTLMEMQHKIDALTEIVEKFEEEGK